RDMLIRLWDVASGNEIRQLRGHCSWVRSIAFSPDGKRLVSGGQDYTVRLWDVATGEEIRPGSGHGDVLLALALSPDEKTLVTGGSEGAVHFWDTTTGKEQRVIRSPPVWVTALAISPDTRWIAWSSSWVDPSIVVVDATTGQVVHRLKGHQKAIGRNNGLA